MIDIQELIIENREELLIGKIVCVGRNYAAHAKELNNPIPENPLLFMKPATSVVALDCAFLDEANSESAQTIVVPNNLGSVHHELEISVLIGERLSNAAPDDAIKSILGLGLGLDLTLRDLQSELKANGHPWEVAKGFDGSCPLSSFVEIDQFENLQDIHFELNKNGSIQQRGHTADMLYPIPQLLSTISQYFTLVPGDVVLTGTPAGVSELKCGDQLVGQLEDNSMFSCRVGR